MNPRWLSAALLVAFGATAARAEPWSSLEGGRHLRFDTERGAVHVFRPRGYARASAGIVVYVHGYFSDVDGAFHDHHLAAQFTASRQNALFIVPEAPANKHDEVRFPDLGALLAQVEARGNVTRPDGPLVVIGHSGAYRTLAAWLGFRRIDQLILIDGLYAEEDAFRAFVASAPGHAANKLVLVSVETRARAERLLETLPFAASEPSVPAHPLDLRRGVRRARVLHLASSLDHMALVTSGAVLPVLLRLTPLVRR